MVKYGNPYQIRPAPLDADAIGTVWPLVGHPHLRRHLRGMLEELLQIQFILQLLPHTLRKSLQLR